MELCLLEHGERSALYANANGDLYRFYKDTRTWHGPTAARVDERGVARLRCNRRLDVAMQRDEDVYGAAGSSTTPPAPCRSTTARPEDHLRHALRQLLRHTPSDVERFAMLCGVKVSTAWSYACRVVECWPKAHEAARGLIYPPVLDAMEKKATNRTGTLAEVHARLGLEGDVEWRCLENHFSHLRLARLCVEARQKISTL